jgi:hypothetical protein
MSKLSLTCLIRPTPRLRVEDSSHQAFELLCAVRSPASAFQAMAKPDRLYTPAQPAGPVRYGFANPALWQTEFCLRWSCAPVHEFCRSQAFSLRNPQRCGNRFLTQLHAPNSSKHPAQDYRSPALVRRNQSPRLGPQYTEYKR